jgi:hypothetical protein
MTKNEQDLLDLVRIAARAWLNCPAEQRPSPEAFGIQMAKIAKDFLLQEKEACGR